MKNNCGKAVWGWTLLGDLQACLEVTAKAALAQAVAHFSQIWLKSSKKTLTKAENG
jgi:hypothetical protein